MKKLLCITVFLSIYVPALTAQDDWKISAQLQLRSELDGRDFSDRTHPLTFTSLRTRLGVEKTFSDMVNIMVQFQDSRIFGEEQSTLSAIDNIDLHQGYVKLLQPLNIPLDIQAGRFEVSYGTERFLGTVGWHYVGRAWDGVRLNLKTGFVFDLFALTHSESNGYVANAIPGIYPIPSISETSQSLYGLWTTFNADAMNRFDLFGYYNVRRNVNNEPDNDYSTFTLGMNHQGKYGSLATIAEAAYQLGETFNTDIAAYLLSLQLIYSTGGVKIGAGADILSGTEIGSDDYNSFSADFGTNHKFYGYMDYFINIPGNTANAGLHDFYLTSSFQLDIPLNIAVNFHHFTTNQDVFYSAEEDDYVTAFGQELDIVLRYDLVPGTSISWGGSLFFPGDVMKLRFATEDFDREDTSFWTYLMITAGI